MNLTREEQRWQEYSKALTASGEWTYKGADQWNRPHDHRLYSTAMAHTIMVQERKEKERQAKWHKDTMGDYIITIDRSKEGLPIVSGRIIRCPIVRRFNKRYWRTECRWLLLVKDSFYGFYRKMREAMEKFDKDCVPKGVCPDCGLPTGSYNCCQNDEDLWK